jgi:RimJ/RimL family protein N-acetyltransferase
MSARSACITGSASRTGPCCRSGCCRRRPAISAASGIETARLSLTPLGDDDGAFIIRLLNEPSFLRYIGDRGVRTLGDARRYIREGPVAGYALHGHGLMRVGLKPDGTPIGICGVLRRDTLPEPDLGFSLLPEYWSQGYAHEAAAAVMRHAREVLKLGRVLAITTTDNEPSMRLLDKLGFRFDRLVRLGTDPTELRLFVSMP